MNMRKLVIMLMMLMLLMCILILAACKKDITVPDTTNQPIDEETPPKPDEQPVDATTDEENQTLQVDLYFSDTNLTDIYRIKKEVVIGKDDEVAMAALEAWVKGPEHEALIGLINSNVTIQSVKEVDGTAHVSFSKEIQNSNLGSSGELMLVEQIAMIMQQFGYDQTQILVEGKIGEALLGHVSTGEPILANDPESYLWVDEIESQEIVIQNEAFRIYEPAPEAVVKDRIVVKGLARVYEGTVLYEFEDGHNILAEGFTTAKQGAPEWGEFEIIIEFDEVANNSGSVILFEESAKDGSRRNELIIPVKVKN